MRIGTGRAGFAVRIVRLGGRRWLSTLPGAGAALVRTVVLCVGAEQVAYGIRPRRRWAVVGGRGWSEHEAGEELGAVDEVAGHVGQAEVV